MKRQLLPLLLCLFVTFSAMSFITFQDENLNPIPILNADYQYTIGIETNFNSQEITDDYFNYYLQNSNQYKDYFQYFSETTLGGGISLNKEFSYNIADNSTSSSTIFLSPIHLQGNLFNQGLFYGFALTIILLNLVCFFVFDEKLFVYLSATVTSLTISLFYAEGLFSLIGFVSHLQNQIMQSTITLFAVGLGALFASKYLSIKEFYPKLVHITLPLFGVSLLLIITAWINNSLFIASVANSLLFGVLSLYFLTGVLIFSKKNYAKFYVIASVIPLLFSIDFFVLRPFGIDFLFTEAVHIKVATLFEVLLLSYAIMYRMQAVKEEGELRQTEMRIFLKRQDVMSRSKVEELIEDVYLENLIMQYDLDGLEIKLLQYISEGKTNTKIARKLKLSETEVVDFTKELYQKLEISEHIHEDYRMVNSQPDYIYN